MNVSVVVCAHTMDRWSDLQDALESVRRQTRPAAEVFLVVDHNPELLERARAADLPATVIDNDQERGLGGARNAGLARSTSDVVAFLDDDAMATRDWLGLLLEPYEDPAVLGVGGAITPRWDEGRPEWFPEEFDWTVGCTYLGMPTRPEAVRNMHGCNMSFRREVLEAAGRFRLGYGCDETEACIRISRMRPDGRFLFVPAASVSHRIPGTRSNLRHFLTRCYFEGGSKAVVARLQGADRGLAAEREYTRRVLPAGVLRGLEDVRSRRDRAGLLRAAAIVAGLGATAGGYVRSSFALDDAARRRGWAGASLR